MNLIQAAPVSALQRWGGTPVSPVPTTERDDLAGEVVDKRSASLTPVWRQ